MDWQSQLITVYLTTCKFFSQLSPYIFLKISPNSNPSFTDEEAISIYIFGILQNLKSLKSIHRFAKNFLSNWFPKLPSYEGFLYRINNLDKVFPELSKNLLQDEKFTQAQNNSESLVVVDSLPIMMARNFRAHRCNTAKDIASIGYCSSKDTYYYGVKLHLIANHKSQALASPRLMKTTEARIHDLSAIKKELSSIKEVQILGDKAYGDLKTKKKLNRIGSDLHTPVKLSKFKKTLTDDEKVYSKSVSSIRQSIEILFNWLIEASDIQIASKVRSSKGLLVHVYGRFSACLFRYMFNF
jgi:hypothetical protein